MKRKKGILLINIGSPASYAVKDVKPYLKSFLMDKQVINLPFISRWVLVNWIIIPRRASFSAAKYKQVWMPEGSPLTVYSERFKQALQSALGENFQVETGMSNSAPNIETGLMRLVKQNVSEILVIPMYPQEAQATSGSAKNEILRLEKKHDLTMPFFFLPAFFADASFQENTVRIARDFLKDRKIDHYLFSYHGLPESQILRVQGCQIDDACCAQPKSLLKGCYRAQCLQTTRALAKSMGLREDQWTYSFQSRLGRAKWLGPSTEETLDKLAHRGIKNLAVLSPSFVADCIETIEELGMEGSETFKKAGGEKLHLVPCLNADSEWAKDFARHCRESLETYAP
jgi:ferrochelatase